MRNFRPFFSFSAMVIFFNSQNGKGAESSTFRREAAVEKVGGRNAGKTRCERLRCGAAYLLLLLLFYTTAWTNRAALARPYFSLLPNPLVVVAFFPFLISFSVPSLCLKLWILSNISTWWCVTKAVDLKWPPSEKNKNIIPFFFLI